MSRKCNNCRARCTGAGKEGNANQCTFYTEQGSSTEGNDGIDEVINKIPTVESTLAARGEWIRVGSWGKCSECGEMVEFNRITNFCPNCSADMRKKVQDE